MMEILLIYFRGKLGKFLLVSVWVLTVVGITMQLVSENIPFSEKSDLFYRIRRLIDEKQMGELFKVMLIKKKKNIFKTGFEID